MHDADTLERRSATMAGLLDGMTTDEALTVLMGVMARVANAIPAGAERQSFARAAVVLGELRSEVRFNARRAKSASSSPWR